MSKAAVSSVKKEPKQVSLSLFESQYQKLNEKQRAAVDQIEGPVMVVAGPGTGKTQVVSMRVANILKKTQMRPSNILCLTFSVSGATAMRNRLRLLIGADAYGVTVSTIHGFAQRIIDDHPMVFEEWSAREQISDIRKHQELNTIIDRNIAHSVLLNAKDPYAKNTDLLSRFSQMKRENMTVEKMREIAKDYAADMQTKSKPGTKVYLRNIESAKKFAEFVELFDQYQSMLKETGTYDYDDMILHVIKALEQEDWLLSGLQERYQYVLVDEFQDTNASQYRLIELLTTYASVPQDPNIFVVGDDDQAIYRFQGANVRNMLSFCDRFPKAPVVVLDVSYRSTQSILDAASTLISENTERLVGSIPGITKDLVSAQKTRGEDPKLLRTASDVAEPWAIADLIEQRLNNGVEPEEIAILTQTNAELFPLYDVLRHRKIPVLLGGKADLLTHPLISQAIAILKCIESPHDDRAFAAALACETFQMHPADVSRAIFAAREQKTPLQKILLSIETNTSLAWLDAERLIRVRDLLLELQQAAPLRTVLESVEHVLRGCFIEFTQEDAKKKEWDPLDLAAIEAFFAHVKARSLDMPGYDFHMFMSDLRFYEDPLYGQVRLTYSLPHLVTSGVRLMTAHQSKGLEFETVILANFKDGHWDKRRQRSMIAVPEELLFGWTKDQKDFERNQDERRVAYVAMTRAKKELLMLCPNESTVGEKSRALSPSGFFAQMGSLPEENLVLKDPENASLLRTRVVRALDDELKAYIRQRLEHFALSPTSIKRFLRDPQEFLLIDLLGQPEEFDEGGLRRIALGSGIHWALREWGTARQQEKELSVDELGEAYEWYLRNRTILTKKQLDALLPLGKRMLGGYFNARLADATPVIHRIEHDYRGRLGDIPLKGKIDRIDLAGKNSATATVIDYKTGSPQTEKNIRGTEEGQLISLGEDGDYFRQIAFYALLLEQADPLLKPSAFAIEFIGDGDEEPETRSMPVTDAEKKEMERIIRAIWKKITDLDFSPL